MSGDLDPDLVALLPGCCGRAKAKESGCRLCVPRWAAIDRLNGRLARFQEIVTRDGEQMVKLADECSALRRTLERIGHVATAHDQVIIERVFPDARIGIGFGLEPDDVSWFAIVGRGESCRSASGLLAELGADLEKWLGAPAVEDDNA